MHKIVVFADFRLYFVDFTISIKGNERVSSGLHIKYNPGDIHPFVWQSENSEQFLAIPQTY